MDTHPFIHSFNEYLLNIFHVLKWKLQGDSMYSLLMKISCEPQGLSSGTNLHKISAMSMPYFYIVQQSRWRMNFYDKPIVSGRLWPKSVSYLMGDRFNRSDKTALLNMTQFGTGDWE